MHFLKKICIFLIFITICHATFGVENEISENDDNEIINMQIGKNIQRKMPQISERQMLTKIRTNLMGATNAREFKKRLQHHCSAAPFIKTNNSNLLKYFVGAEANSKGCSSENGTVSCCLDVNVDFFFIHVHNHFCLNLTYLPDSVSIRVIISVGGRAVFNMTISATNPPPLCIPFGISELGYFCFELYDLKIANHIFSGCSLFKLVLLHQEVVNEKLGCFKLPFPVNKNNDGAIQNENNQF